MKLTLGFSPCPNDTFIFDALVNGKIDTEGLEFEVLLEDVQTLNRWAMEGRLDISKISYGVLPLIMDHYSLLQAGGALGKGVGPLLISSAPLTNPVEELSIAIPGEQTTAHMLFSMAYPSARNKRFMLFSEIEDAVLSGDVDLGVIIHENRFTYQKKGLHKVIDLGDFWEQQTGGPIPLGGIVIKQSLESALAQKTDSLIRESLEFAFKNYPELPPYVRAHSQEMEEEVMRQHIDLYVNQFSLGLGDEGMKAVQTLLNVYRRVYQDLPSSSAAL